MQFFEFFVGGFGLLRVVSNIDEVELQGFELSANFQATDWLTLFAGYALTDSEIKEEHRRPGRSATSRPTRRTTRLRSARQPDELERDKFGTVDARFALVNDNWSVALVGKNVTDERSTCRKSSRPRSSAATSSTRAPSVASPSRSVTSSEPTSERPL
jgi:outer membrane receptor protein involved in Fe transport